MDALYLDNNARTRTDERVVRAMLPFFTQHYGNPSSLHARGRAAASAIETARRQTAALMGCRPEEVVFTGSGTEGDNTAIQSALVGRPGHIIVSACEHDAVLKPIADAEHGRWTVTRLRPGRLGVVTPEMVAAALRPDTVFVSVMGVNNECGAINPVESIAQIIQTHNRRGGRALLHVDAVQCPGKTRMPDPAAGIDYMVISGHKFHGPPGIAALMVREGAPFVPLMEGGAQEDKRRAGTENTPAIVGLGVAADLARALTPADHAELAHVRDYLEHRIRGIFGDDVMVIGAGAPRVPGTLLVAFRGFMGRDVQAELASVGIEAGTGSACSCLKNPQPSATVQALDTPADFAMGTLRLSLCHLCRPSSGLPLARLEPLFAALTAIRRRGHARPAAETVPPLPGQRGLVRRGGGRTRR